MTPRSLAAVAVCVVALAATAAPSAGAVVPAASLASAPYAPWAHAHWYAVQPAHSRAEWAMGQMRGRALLTSVVCRAGCGWTTTCPTKPT